jgi:hypothetical protein
MSMVESLRSGFSFFLMCMGISSPAKKTKPASKPVPEPRRD